MNDQGVAELQPKPGEPGPELIIFDAAMLEARRYWREHLAGIDPARPEALPPDMPRWPADARQRWPAGARRRATVTTDLPAALAARLGRLTGDGPFLLHVVITAAAMLCLGKYGGGPDVVVGCPPRLPAAGGTSRGANALAIRERLDPGPTFKQFLGHVRGTLLDAYAHQQYPFAKVLEDLGQAEPAGRCPLFDLAVALDGLHGTLADTGHDITLTATHSPGAVFWTLEYDAGLFRHSTIARFSHHLAHLLGAATAAPDRGIADLPILDAEERQRLTVTWSHGAPARAGLPPVHVRFAAQAALTPDAVATEMRELRGHGRQEKRDAENDTPPPLEGGGWGEGSVDANPQPTPPPAPLPQGEGEHSVLTYGELDACANQLAHYLRGRGVGVGGHVGILMGRSLDLPVAILGVLKAGAAYVPLDPDYPRERLAYILADADAALVLSDAALAPLAAAAGVPVLCLDTGWEPIGRCPATPPDVDLPAGTPAYLIYTSGSTGRPKGCRVGHDNLACYLDWAGRHYLGDGAGTFALYSSLAFDLTVTSLFLPLLNGRTLFQYRQDAAIADILRDSFDPGSPIDAVKLTPAHIMLLAQLPLPGNSPGNSNVPGKSNVAVAIVGGEALTQDHVRVLFGLNPAMAIYNEYGPTEATVGCVVARMRPDAERVPIGRPIDGARVYVLAPDRSLVPPGVPGELHIGGAGVFLGYQGDQRCGDADAGPFVACPDLGEQRLYRTGDRVRWTEDGELEFLGRADDQVKIRGYRIEPAEIEARLCEHEAVAQAVVLARPPAAGEPPELVMYVVTNRVLLPGELQEHLRARLPDYMVPARLVTLAELPLNPHGKVDRSALPDPAAPQRGGPAPRDAVEARIAEIWGAVLGLDGFGVHDDFFLLGGQSLKATRVMSRIQRELNVELEWNSIFSHPTVETLAALVRRKQPSALAAIQPVPAALHYTLSDAQQRLWVLHRMAPDQGAYVISDATWLEGRLDVAVLARTLDRLVRRHEALRTTFTPSDGTPSDGTARQVIHDDPAETLTVEDLTGADEDRLRERVAAEVAVAFDLERGPLFRAHLFRVGPERHLLLLVLHHIVCDGWSLTVLAREAHETYAALAAGREPALPPLPIQYKDYADWQLRRLDGPGGEADRAFWLGRLAGELPALNLPTDFPRPVVKSFSGHTRRYKLDDGPVAALEALAREQGASLFMAVLALVAALLHRYCGQEDLVIGTPVAGRRHPDLEHQVGFYVNMLPLRLRVDGRQPFRDLLAAVATEVRQALDHQDYPFDRLVDELQVRRDAGRSPLFDVAVTVADPVPRPTLRDIEAVPVEAPATTSKFDLTFTVTAGEDGWGVAVEYRTDLFSDTRIDRMAGHLRALLRHAVAEPGCRVHDLDLLPDWERVRIVSGFNHTAAAYPGDSSIAACFEDRVRAAPDRLAVSSPDGGLTFRQLAGRAGGLARVLTRRGVRPGDPVGVLLDRPQDIVVALVAIVMAGGAYVPLDTAWPEARRTFILRDTGTRVVVAEANAGATADCTVVSPTAGDASSAPPPLEGGGWGEGSIGADPQPTPPPNPLPQGEGEYPSASPSPSPHPAYPDAHGGVAYIAYTSGSTGQPKGALITHRSVLRLVLGTDYVQIRPDDRILATGSIAFDASTFEIWGALLNGACVCFSPPRSLLDPGALRAVIARDGVSVMFLTTSLFNQLAEADAAVFRPLRVLLTGGERVSPAYMDAVRRACPGLDLLHVYGPTENTTFTTWFSVIEPPGADVPIGWPIANTTVHVLDGQGRPQPIGVPGEIHVGGDGLALGYLGRAALTAQRFVPHPFRRGERLYRTGDFGCWQADGALTFAGRIDNQVKVRGFRVEPGEIESRLAQHPAVAEVVVMPRRTVTGTLDLRCWYTARRPIDAAELRQFLAGSLPDFMIPADFVALARMPLNSSGKIDRTALPDPTPGDGGEAPPEDAPGDAREQVLQEVFAGVLGGRRVVVTDNLFDCGNDSIKSIQVVSRLGRLGWRLAVADVFRYPRIAELARRLGQAQEPAVAEAPAAGTLPLTPIQRWFFEYCGAQHHFNQDMLLRARERLDPGMLGAAVGALVEHHDALRMRFGRGPDGVVQRYGSAGASAGATLALVDLMAEQDAAATLDRHADDVQRSLHLGEGPLFRAVLYRTADADFLLLVIHHLVVDGVSWRILIEDLERACRQHARGFPIDLGPKTASFQRWALALESLAGDPALAAERDYWRTVEAAAPTQAPADGADLWGTARAQHLTVEAAAPTQAPTDSADIWGTARALHVRLTAVDTQLLLTGTHHAYRTEINDLLLCALARALERCDGGRQTLLTLEGHGREPIAAGLDVGRTVGWFTATFPFMLRLESDDLGTQIRHVKEALRGVPRHGIGYGVLRYLAPGSALSGRPRLSFNYLGEVSEGAAEPLFRLADGRTGRAVAEDCARDHELEIIAVAAGGVMNLGIIYQPTRHAPHRMEALMAAFAEELRAVAQHCAARQVCAKTPSDFTDCPLTLADYDAFLRRQALDAGDIDDVYGLAPLQEGLLFETLYAPEARAYVVQMGYRIDGALDAACFRQAWDALAARHPALRTAFFQRDLPRPIQMVFRQRPPEWLTEDLRGLDVAAQERRIAEYRERDRARGFDLARDKLLRLALFRTAEHCSIAVWTYHHLVLDGWSMGVLYREFGVLYDRFRAGLPDDRFRVGQPADLPPAGPYADHISGLAGRDRNAARAFWRDSLDGYDRPARIPHAVMPDRPGSDAVSERCLELDRDRTRRLLKLAADRGTTLSTVVRALWGALLSRYADQPDVVFGAVVSGRPPGLAGVESMVGLFINTVAVRVLPDPDAPLPSLFAVLQRAALESEPHQHLPLAEIQALTALGRELIDHVVTVETYPVDASRPAGGDVPIAITELTAVDYTHYPFGLVVLPGDCLRFRLVYRQDCHSGRQVARIADHLACAIDRLIEDPDRPTREITALPPDEAALVLHAFNPVPGPAPAWTVPERFAAQVARTPEHIAVHFPGGAWTYRELDARAVALAVHLAHALRIRPEAPVGVLLPPSAQAVAAVLGVMRAGGAFLPLDPRAPTARLAELLEDAGCEICVAGAADADRLCGAGVRHVIVAEAPRPGADAETDTPPPLVGGGWGEGSVGANPRLTPPPNPLPQGEGEYPSSPLSGAYPDAYAALPPIRPEALAYIIYTSGSTGRPKGCQVEHRNLAAYLDWAAGHYLERAGFPRAPRTALFTSLTFDLTLTCLLLPLVTGGSIETFAPNAELPDVLAAIFGPGSAIDWVKLTPSHLTLLEELRLPSIPVGLAIVGGEVLTPRQVRALTGSAPGIRIVNEYGPTETTVGCIAADVTATDARILIGRPIANTRVHILGHDGQPVPIEVPGEIHIGGAGVSRGYLHRPELNRERFVPSPIPPAGTLYRTGDLGCWLPDGSILCLGRIDDQVKIRGHRIEPGEIEVLLAEHQEVIRAAVVALPADDPTELCAYVQGTASVAALRAFLAERLPDYMVPARIFSLDELPLTGHGKVDRRRLPPPDASDAAATSVAPRTETEAQVLEVFRDVLGVPVLGVHDHFFEHGGHSLKAIQVVSRLQRDLGMRLPLRELFQHPTAAEVAALLKDPARVPAEVIPRAPERPHYPLSHAQKRLWMLHWLGGARAYNMPEATTLRGALDAAALARALTELVERHEALRTTFAEVDGEPRQIVHATVRTELRVIDLRAAPDPAGRAREIGERDAVTPFDLAVAPLFRATLLRLGDKEHVFLFTVHHIIGDGWSMTVMGRDLRRLYAAARAGASAQTGAAAQAGHAQPLPPLRVRYRDYAEWQATRDFHAQERYWLDTLAGAPGTIALPCDFTPDKERAFRGSTVYIDLDAADAQRLGALALARRTTLATVLLALFKLLLFKLSGQGDLCVGLGIAGRDHRDLEHLVGLFVNVLPIRSRIVDGMDLAGLLAEVDRAVGEAMEHRDYPLDLLVQQMNPMRRANRQALFNVVYTFQNFTDVRLDAGPVDGLEDSGAAGQQEGFARAFETSKFDLCLIAAERAGGGIRLSLEYDSQLFAEQTVRRFVDALGHFARQVAGADGGRPRQTGGASHG